MLRTKMADRIVCVAVAVMLAVSVCMWGAVEAVQGDGSHEVGYESLLFDSSRVHTIDITMDDWDEMIANAAAEEYRQCDITIDGEKLGTAAIRAKGNTSLSSVASLGSTRYSFKVEFDQYVKGKTYHGLDKLSLNNLIQDATMMKDYLAYTLMGKMGVPSPLCSYVQINVNGEPWGLYLAVEGVEDGFLERNGMTRGELYKPDSLSFGGGRGNGGDFDIENFRISEDEKTESADGSGNAASEGGASAQADGDGGSSGGSSGAQQETDGAGENTRNDFAASDGNTAQQPAESTPEQTDGEQEPADRGQQENGRAQDWSRSDFAASGGDSGDQDGEAASGGSASWDDFAASNGGSADGWPETAGGEERSFDFSNMGGGFGGFNFGMGSDDVKLVYTNDDPDSYSNIFNNAKTDITAKDKNRLIASLKKLNAKEDIDSVVYRDEVTTYLAVHNFLCNDDSYTGMMVHNYYLYEENGKLAIIPWDYNLGFGGFSAGTNATSTVNSPIDNPVGSGTTDSRPLIAWIFTDEEALNAYHETYDRFISECVENGWLGNEITRVQEMISPYLKKDESAFYSMADFEKAVDTLQAFCAKRGQSVRGQLDGTIPSTSNGQRSSSALIDAGEISTSAMGSMSGMGGGGFGGGGGFSRGDTDRTEQPEGGTDETGGDFAGSSGGRADDDGGGSSGGSAGGTAATQENPPEQTETTKADTAPATGEGAVPAETERSRRNSGGERREGGFGGGFSGWGGYSNRGYNTAVWTWTGICAALLLAAVLVFSRIGSHNR